MGILWFYLLLPSFYGQASETCLRDTQQHHEAELSVLRLTHTVSERAQADKVRELQTSLATVTEQLNTVTAQMSVTATALSEERTAHEATVEQMNVEIATLQREKESWQEAITTLEQQLEQVRALHLAGKHNPLALLCCPPLLHFCRLRLVPLCRSSCVFWVQSPSSGCMMSRVLASLRIFFVSPCFSAQRKSERR